MNNVEKAYLFLWLLSILAALAVVFIPPRPSIFSKSYQRLLLVPWRMITFLIAGTSISMMAPYAGDPTWDRFDGALMAILTYLTAPWSVGTLYRVFKRKVGWRDAFVAINLWLLSAAWCYDAYLLWRDGEYPATWDINILASSCLYFAAGLFWNLSWAPARGAHLLFTEDTWFHTSEVASFRHIFWIAIPFIAFAAALLLPFLWGGWG